MRKFSLSANIHNGFAEGVQYIPTPNGKRAISDIVEDYHSGIHSFTIIGSYGTGKSSFLLALESDLQRQTKYLLDASNLSDAETFEFLNVVGDYADLSSLLKQSLKSEASRQNVIDDLDAYYKNCQKENKFLIIVLDEFGKVLEHAAKNNPEQELYLLQKLADYVSLSSSQILLLTTLHQNFGAYSKGLTEAQVNEWIKVKGRFKEITFVEPVEQLLLLASQQIKEETPIESPDNIQALYELARETQYSSDSFTLETAKQLYPLDPFSAYAVTAAIQRYGQNERSLFTFLAAKGSGSISSFLPLENTTYNLQKVYDYISYSFYSYLKEANVDSMSWSSMQVAIERAQGHSWDSDIELYGAICIVKAIGLLNLLSKAGFRLSEKQMARYAQYAMAIDDADNIIRKLIQKKIVRFAAYQERLMLFDGTDVDIEAEIRDAKLVVPRPVNFIDELRVYFNKRISPVKAHFYQKGTPRFFDYLVQEAPLDITPVGDTDGYVELIFSTQKDALSQIKEISERSDQALIFVYFKNTGDIIDHLYNVILYRYLKDKIIGSNDLVAIREIDKLREYEESLLNKAISDNLFSYMDRVAWVYKGSEVRVSSHRDFNKLLSQVCNEIYYKTPVLNNELFNKHKLSTSISGAKAKYMQALLGSGDKPDLGFDENKFPPEKTIYYSLLKNTGLHVNGVFADAPSNDDILPLWTACEEFLRSTQDKSRKLSELVKLLTNQPYKIKDGLLEFWLPTYLFIKRNDYSLYGENGQFIPTFNMELIDLMKKHIGDFKVKAYAVDGIKLQLFNQYRKFLNLEDNASINESAFIETIKPFLFFYKQLNEYAKHTKMVSHAETIKFRQVLAAAKDPEKAFLEDLPAALGYDDEKLQDPVAVQNYCQAIQRAVRELRSCYNQLIDRIEENLIEKLGFESGEYAEYIEEIHRRLSKVKPHLLTPRQKEFYQHVVARFDKRAEWYQSVCYAVLDSPLDRLTDDQEPKLHDDLVFLFRECEQNAVLSESLNYTIDEAEEQRSKQLETKLDALLSGDNNLDVYTLMRMLQKRISND